MSSYDPQVAHRFRARGATDGDSVIERYVLIYSRGLSIHNAGTMINEKAPANDGRRHRSESGRAKMEPAQRYFRHHPAAGRRCDTKAPRESREKSPTSGAHCAPRYH